MTPLQAESHTARTNERKGSCKTTQANRPAGRGDVPEARTHVLASAGGLVASSSGSRLGRATSTAQPASPVRTRPGPAPPPEATAPAKHGAGHGDHSADHGGNGAGHGGHDTEHGRHGASTVGRRGDRGRLRVQNRLSRASEAARLQAWRVVGGYRQQRRRQPQGRLLSSSHIRPKQVPKS